MEIVLSISLWIYLLLHDKSSINLPVLLDTQLHLPSPCNLTHSPSNLSSSGVHGPFLHPCSGIPQPIFQANISLSICMLISTAVSKFYGKNWSNGLAYFLVNHGNIINYKTLVEAPVLQSLERQRPIIYIESFVIL